MESLITDIRYALRTFARAPGFAVAAILTLALGIGATSAMFSVVNGVLLRALPYPEPNRLVTLRWNQSARDMQDLVAWNTSFTSAGGAVTQPLDLVGGAEPLQIGAVLVTGGLFKTLGVPAELGRTLGDDDDRIGGPEVVVLTHEFWERGLGRDPRILGRPLTLSGRTYSVVGVMPAGFQVPGRTGELFAPVSVVLPNAVPYRGVHFLRTAWRLKPGVTPAQAQQDFLRLGQRLAEVAPDENKNRLWEMTSLTENIVGDVRKALWILLGAVTLVLLVACSNFANLLLARSVTRSHEIAIRSSLGAGRGRLVRQLVTESLVLAIAGGALGVLLASWGVDLLLALRPAHLPRLDDIRVDSGVLAFTVILSAVTGLLFGLLPAFHAARGTVSDSLKEGAATTTPTGGAHRLLGSMVVAQIGLALVLLIGAGLLLNGFCRLRATPPGFDPNGVLSLRLEVPEAKYKDVDSERRYRAQVLESVRQLPGVQVGMVSELPLSGDQLSHNFAIEGRPVTPGDEPELWNRSVSGDYFATLRIPLRAGRGFEAGDRAGAPLVVIANESMVRRYFPDQNPLGQRIRWVHQEGPPQWITIVGIAADVRHFGLAEGEDAAVYTPYEQSDQDWKRWMCLVVRGRDAESAGFARRVKERIWTVDSAIPITQLRTVSDVVAGSLAEQRFTLTLIALFSGVALVLSALGIYGVTSYVAAQRTREIGLRLALGAAQRDVFALVLLRGARLVSLGVAIGLVGAFLLTRFIRSLVYQVSTHDPLTYAAVVTALAAVALASCMIPALRASRVDPLTALRRE